MVLHGFFVVDRAQEKCIFYYQEQASTFSLDSSTIGQFAPIIAFITERFRADGTTEKIQFFITSNFKLSFDVGEKLICFIVASADYDDLELIYLISQMSNDVRAFYNQYGGDLSRFPINNYIWQGHIRHSSPDRGAKTILMRLGNILNELDFLVKDIDLLKTTPSYDSSNLPVISTMETALEQKILQVREKLKELPYVGGEF
jgi:hypothetical protein